MDEINYGAVWSGVRAGLMYEHEALKKAFAQKNYEKESAGLDAVARRITDRIKKCVETSKEQKQDG